MILITTISRVAFAVGTDIFEEMVHINPNWKSSLIASALLLFVFPKNSEAVFEIERCFGELGCFEIGGPFFDPINRPFNVLPNHPSSINTTFRLYTTQNKENAQVLQYNEDFQFNSTNFDNSLETKFIIHGFREMEDEWMIELKNELIYTDPMNVITVDWEKGATIPYTLASSNTRVVGAEIALLIQKLQRNAGANLDQIHLIGFSLGAHIAGYAGARLKGQIRRITGLDPAGPLFAGLSHEVRLDPTDAGFVDAIHTDAKKILELSFGTKQTVGHVDFYPNGGHDQPGCPHTYINKVSVITIDVIVKGLDEAGAEAGCRHSRATKLYIDSVFGTLPVGYPCDNYDKFLKGECATCGKDGSLCGVMGSTAAQFAPINAPTGGVKLYLLTGDNKPYVRFHYNLNVKIPKDDSRFGKFGFYVYIKTVSFGKLTATLKGEFGQSVTDDLNVDAQVFEGETEYKFLFTSQYHLGDIKSIDLQFKPSSSFQNFVNLKWKVNEDLPIQSIALIDMYKLFKLRQIPKPIIYCSDTKTLKANINATYTTDGKC